jgi:beta-mannanase
MTGKIKNSKKMFNPNKNLKKIQGISATAFVLVLAIIGAHFLFSAKAASPYVAIEAEGGTVATPATKVASSAASGGTYVQFGTTTTTTTPPPPTSGVTLLGLWGGGTVTAKTLGVTQQIDEEYAGGTNWTSYNASSSSLRLMLAVGALTVSQSQAIAKSLVSAGQGNALIRPMWEMNQHTWNDPWNEQSMSASQYISTWINDIYNPMKAIAPNLAFIWNPNGDDGNNLAGRTSYDTYPGDAYVQYIGADTYDHYGGSINGNATAMDAFAAQHGKPYVVPEWGLNGKSDPTFMNNMISFIQNPANNVYLQSYFSYNGPTNSDLTQFPTDEGLYKAAFKNE